MEGKMTRKDKLQEQTWKKCLFLIAYMYNRKKSVSKTCESVKYFDVGSLQESVDHMRLLN